MWKVNVDPGLKRKSAAHGLKIIVASTLLATAASALAQDGGDPRLKAPVVKTAVAGEVIGSSRSFTGIVMARVQSDLGFRVNGKVLERLVDVGQTVVKGQALMRLDRTDLDLALRAKKNAVISAHAAVNRTHSDEQRFARLLSSGAASREVYDEAKQAYDTAVAQLDAAVADADYAQNEANYALLSADCDGVVTDTLAEPGQVVSAGQVVVKLAHNGDREASIDLPETIRPAIGSTGTAIVYGSNGQTIGATLRQLSDAADPATRTFEARYVLQSNAEIPLGSTVKVAIDRSTAQVPATAVQVPIGAVWDNGSKTGVWTVQDGQTVAFKPVKVLNIGNEDAVINGVSKGTTVVAVGVNFLNDGMEVRPYNEGIASK